jgi:hypothetical protein
MQHNTNKHMHPALTGAWGPRRQTTLASKGAHTVRLLYQLDRWQCQNLHPEQHTFVRLKFESLMPYMDAIAFQIECNSPAVVCSDSVGDIYRRGSLTSCSKSRQWIIIK